MPLLRVTVICISFLSEWVHLFQMNKYHILCFSSFCFQLLAMFLTHNVKLVLKRKLRVQIKCNMNGSVSYSPLSTSEAVRPQCARTIAPEKTGTLLLSSSRPQSWTPNKELKIIMAGICPCWQKEIGLNRLTSECDK